MRRILFFALLLGLGVTKVSAQADVYFTKEITAEQLVKLFQALGVTPKEGQRVAVKISTGESQNTNYLRPDFIKPLVQLVDGTLVECNTAYGGNRSTTASHRRAIEQRGYTVANGFKTVDIMDEEGSMNIPVLDTKWLKYDMVGSHLANYDFMINLAHFKGHAMGGNGQDAFLESMAAAAQAVHNYFKQEGKNIVYIDVMNNLSVDCDCDGSPAAPQMKDVGMLASLDPVALDKACLDLVFNHQSTSGDNADPLIQRINRQHGTRTVEYAEQIGLGSQSYNLIDLDQMSDVNVTTSGKTLLYNVYDTSGKQVCSMSHRLAGLAPGVYIVNGGKRVIK